MINVYYNNSCKVCNIEISHYKKKKVEGINWIDISGNNKLVSELNKTPEQLLRRLHVAKDDELYAGAADFILLWQYLPNYKWLSKIFALPIIYQLFNILYELIAFFLYHKNKHQLVYFEK